MRAVLDGKSVSEAKEHAAGYVRGRDASTISSCDSEYKRVVEFCMEAARKRVSRNVFMRSGDWRSFAGDICMRVVDVGVIVVGAVL